MFCFIRDLLLGIFEVTTSKRKNLIFTLLMLRKQNEILKRQIESRNERLRPSFSDRWSLAMISAVSTLARSHLQLFKPETVLAWQRKLISKGWTYPKRNPGRRPVKLGIDIHHITVNRIIQNFRKGVRIAASGSWSRFLMAHWDSMYGMDFMTIDSGRIRGLVESQPRKRQWKRE